MPDDEIVSLDSGEQVKVVGEEQILIPGPDPEIEKIIARRAEHKIRQDQLRQEQLDIIATKREEESAHPAVPPEKRVF